MATVMTVLAVLMWMALGALIALACVSLRGRRRWRSMASKGSSLFGLLLDSECEVLKGDGEWHRCRVVAVSHRGALAVRNVSDTSGKHARWIPKDEVPEKVRWKGSGDE